MKEELQDGDVQELREALRQWQPEVSLSPRFSEQVWRRIGATEGAVWWRPSFWMEVWGRWELLFRRPAVVAAWLLIFTTMGIGLGAWRAEAYAVRTEKGWQEAYVRSVSPNTMAESP